MTDQFNQTAQSILTDFYNILKEQEAPHEKIIEMIKDIIEVAQENTLAQIADMSLTENKVLLPNKEDFTLEEVLELNADNSFIQTIYLDNLIVVKNRVLEADGQDQIVNNVS